MSRRAKRKPALPELRPALAVRLLDPLEPPISGYAGTIDGSIDFAIVREAAEGPGNVVLVGPIENLDPLVLPRRANIHFTGRVSDDDAVALVEAFDVVLAPFSSAEDSQ